MMYLLKHEAGDYVDAAGRRCTLCCCRRMRSQEGINAGWTHFDTYEACLAAWGLTYDPLPYTDDDFSREEVSS